MVVLMQYMSSLWLYAYLDADADSAVGKVAKLAEFGDGRSCRQSDPGE